MRIVKGDASWGDKCLEIGRKLPEFFTPEGLAEMEQDLETHLVYLALDGEELVGFLTIDLESPEVADISWMAVDVEKQGQGVGKELMDFVAQDLTERKVRLLKVKTLSEIVEYQPYENTRSFYRSCGFILFETIEMYEPWGPENPCAIYVKIL